MGKYLEHARIYYFKNAPTPIYFASADIMPRNLERRIEILTPAVSEKIAHKLLEIVTLQLKDNLQAHELQSNGEYKKLAPDQNPINAQEMFEEMTNMLYNASSNTKSAKALRLIKRMMGES